MLGQNWVIHNNLPFWTQFFLIFLLLKFAVPMDAVDPIEKPKSEPCNKWTIVCNEEKTKCEDAFFGVDYKSKPTKRFNAGVQNCGEEIEIDISNINSGEGQFVADFVKNNAKFCRKSSTRTLGNGTKDTASTMMTMTTSKEMTTTTTIYSPQRFESILTMEEKLGPNMGFFVQAKPEKNWRNISFEFYRNGGENDENFLLEFVAINQNHEIQIGHMKEIDGKMKKIIENKTDEMRIFNEENEFQIEFKLSNTSIDIIVNDTIPSLWSVQMDENPEIGAVKINADFKMNKNATIYHTPWVFFNYTNRTEFKIGKSVQLKGKILPNIETFAIRFYSGAFDPKWNDKTLKEICFNAEFGHCTIILSIIVDFKNSKTMMGNFLVNSSHLKEWNNQTYPNRFVEGDNFQITIKCENNDTFKLIYDHSNGEIDEIKTKFSWNEAEHMRITGGIFLYDKPKIISI